MSLTVYKQLLNDFTSSKGELEMKFTKSGLTTVPNVIGGGLVSQVVLPLAPSQPLITRSAVISPPTPQRSICTVSTLEHREVGVFIVSTRNVGH